MARQLRAQRLHSHQCGLNKIPPWMASGRPMSDEDNHESDAMDVDIEHPHIRHKSQHSWLDMSVSFAALFVSLVSIFIAWHHGETMKELVRQNERLVEANSL